MSQFDDRLDDAIDLLIAAQTGPQDADLMGLLSPVQALAATPVPPPSRHTARIRMAAALDARRQKRRFGLGGFWGDNWLGEGRLASAAVIAFMLLLVVLASAALTGHPLYILKRSARITQPSPPPAPSITPAVEIAPLRTAEPPASPPALVPDLTPTPELTTTPEPTETPELIETPEPTETPELIETPELTETLELTETPEPTETLELTETPEPTETPELTEAPEPTETPELTETPSDASAS